MTTFVGSQHDFGKALHALVQLTQDTVQAYNSALDRLEDESFKQALMGYRDVLREHIADIDRVLVHHNRAVPSGPSYKQYLTTGKVAIADMLGDDFSILKALHTTVHDLEQAYRRVSEHDDRWRELMPVLTQARDDVSAQALWIDQASQDVL